MGKQSLMRYAITCNQGVLDAANGGFSTQKPALNSAIEWSVGMWGITIHVWRCDMNSDYSEKIFDVLNGKVHKIKKGQKK